MGVRNINCIFNNVLALSESGIKHPRTHFVYAWRIYDTDIKKHKKVNRSYDILDLLRKKVNFAL